MGNHLSVERKKHSFTQAPADRGPLLTDADVAALLCFPNPNSPASRRRVRETVPHKKRIGHNTVRWFRNDVLDWVASQDAA